MVWKMLKVDALLLIMDNARFSKVFIVSYYANHDA